MDPIVAWERLKSFETAQDIREFFQNEGIKGIKESLTTCPIASWMHEATKAEIVRVGDVVRVYSKPTESSNFFYLELTGEFEHTWATTNFMEKFDEGQFPELDEDETTDPEDL